MTEKAPPQRLKRPIRTIIAYHAKCRGCPWMGRRPSETTVHVLAEGHDVAETRYYLAEAPA